MIPLAIAGSVAVGYAVVSAVLLRNPHLIHTKQTKFEKLGRCVHISHRGGAAEQLENTMTAFAHAVALGTDMLELDVHLTKDKQVVVCHDANLKRTCQVDGTIPQFEFADLPQLSPTLQVSFGGSAVVTGGADRQIPLLESVFAKYPTIPISVDIKVDNDELVDLVGDMIKKYDRQSITVWGSFRPGTAQKCYQKDPDIALHSSARNVAFLYLLYFTGLLPFVPIKASSFSIPFPRAIELPITRDRPHIVAFVDWLFCRPKLFAHLKARGIPTFLWVVNKEVHMEEAFRMGVTGLMTDKPTLLREFLDARPHLRG